LFDLKEAIKMNEQIKFEAISGVHATTSEATSSNKGELTCFIIIQGQG
jgi:hypothetical protein